MKNLKNYLFPILGLLFISFTISDLGEFNFFATLGVFVTLAVLQFFVLGSPSYSAAMALLGFTKNCSERSGGVDALYLAKVSDVDSFTLGTLVDAKKWATVTMEAGAFFTKYEFEKNSVEFKESTARENGSTRVTKTIEFMLPLMSQNSRDVVEEIMIESNCGLIAIAVDNNNQKWVVGYTKKHLKNKPLELQTSEATTGKALTDANGDIVILVAEDTEKSRTFIGEIPLETP